MADKLSAKHAELVRLVQLYRVSQGLQTEQTREQVLAAEQELAKSPTPAPRITGGQPPVPSSGV